MTPTDPNPIPHTPLLGRGPEGEETEGERMTEHERRVDVLAAQVERLKVALVAGEAHKTALQQILYSSIPDVVERALANVNPLGGAYINALHAAGLDAANPETWVSTAALAGTAGGAEEGEGR